MENIYPFAVQFYPAGLFALKTVKFLGLLGGYFGNDGNTDTLLVPGT